MRGADGLEHACGVFRAAEDHEQNRRCGHGGKYSTDGRLKGWEKAFSLELLAFRGREAS